jgi:hypothetical protein
VIEEDPALPHAVRGLGRRSAQVAATLVAVLALAACGSQDQGSNVDPDQVDAVEAPELGACRALTPDDVKLPSNATKTVDCAEPHTAETFAVGPLPKTLEDAAYDDEKVGAFAYQKCSEKFMAFLGADESMIMRTIVSWAWFRPSKEAWENGARWYRCDVVGGGDESASYVDLPETAKGLLRKLSDRWMVCADGASVNGSPKVPCTEDHTWRAVTTIKLGEPEDEYPGDRVVEVTSRDFCSKSVGAWLNYPVDYDYGWTYFHEAEWEAGNRRSVCWAKTDK